MSLLLAAQTTASATIEETGTPVRVFVAVAAIVAASSVAEEFVSSVSLFEEPSRLSVLAERRPRVQFVSTEEFGGAHPTEEVSTPTVRLPRRGRSARSTIGVEEFGGAHPTEEVSARTSTTVKKTRRNVSITEEFSSTPAATLAAEEPAAPLFFTKHRIKLSRVFAEEFSGAHPTEEASTNARPASSSRRLTRFATTEEFSGSLPFEEREVARTAKTLRRWISWSLGEEFGGAHPTEEHSTPPTTRRAVRWIRWSVNEEFGGSFPFDERATALTSKPTIRRLSRSISEEFGGAHPTEEVSSTIARFVSARLARRSVSEEFGGSAPLDERATAPIAKPVIRRLSRSVSEEFGGAHPSEEVSTTTAFFAPRRRARLWSASDDEAFSGSLPLEEQSTPAITKRAIRWISWSANDDEAFSGSLPLEEQSTPTITKRAIRWISWSANDNEAFSGSLPLEESTTTPNTKLTPRWMSWSVSEEEFGAAHPTEEANYARVLVRLLRRANQPESWPEEFAGSLPSEEEWSSTRPRARRLSVPTFVFFTEEFVPPIPIPPVPPRRPIHPSLTQITSRIIQYAPSNVEPSCNVVDTVGVLVEEPPIDLSDIVARTEKQLDRPEVMAWGRSRVTIAERERADEMLRGVREFSGDASLARADIDLSILLAAGYAAADMPVAVLAHKYRQGHEHVLVAVWVDGAWRYADPSRDVPFGAAWPFAEERYARVPEIPTPQRVLEAARFALARPAAIVERRIDWSWVVAAFLVGALVAGAAVAVTKKRSKRRKRRKVVRKKRKR